MVRRRKGSGRRLTALSLADHNLSGHVRVKFAVVFNRSLGPENYGLFSVEWDQDVPRTVARGSRVRDEVGIDPLDGIADMGGNLSRHKGELFHLHQNGVGARHARRNNENERAEYPKACLTRHSAGPI